MAEQLTSSAEQDELALPASRKAWAALLLALASWLAAVTAAAALPAVVLGHLALRDVRKTPPRVGGLGVALAALILGYIQIALLSIALLGPAIGQAFPALAGGYLSPYQAESADQLRQIGQMVHAYADDHGGVLPTSFAQLEMYLEERYDPQRGHIPALLRLPGSRDTRTAAYEWVRQPAGADGSELLASVEEPGAAVLIREREPFWAGWRLVLYVDGSVGAIDERPIAE